MTFFITHPFERSPVVRRNHEVVIGDVAVFAHLFEVEQRAEEIGHAVVALADRLVGAVARTFEVVVDVTQVGPCACAPVFGGRGARALLYGAEVLGDLDVGDLNGIGGGTCEETVEAVGPKLQLRFARKSSQPDSARLIETNINILLIVFMVDRNNAFRLV